MPRVPLALAVVATSMLMALGLRTLPSGLEPPPRATVAASVGTAAQAAGAAPASPAGAAAVATPAPPTPGGTAARWSWPLTPRPTVVRGFQAPPQPWLAGHRGVDLSAGVGVSVLAPADGVVAFRGMVAGRPVLSIDHADGLRSTYEPVTSTLTAGEAVTRGQVVGTLVAGEACPAASCLHWGARRGETYLDPLRLVGAGPAVLLPLG